MVAVQVRLEDELNKKLEDWRLKRRFKSKSAALRELVVSAVTEGSSPEPKTAKERRLVDLLLRSLRHPDDFASDLVVTALEGYGKIAAAEAKDKR